MILLDVKIILEKGMDDALYRCKSYIESGADGIMIHSRQEDGKEILDFVKIIKNLVQDILLSCHLHLIELLKVISRMQG